MSTSKATLFSRSYLQRPFLRALLACLFASLPYSANGQDIEVPPIDITPDLKPPTIPAPPTTSIEPPDFEPTPIEPTLIKPEDITPVTIAPVTIAPVTIAPETITPATITPATITPPAITAPSQVPPGFEILFEPQTTIVDIYFGDEFIDAQMATFTNSEIQFSNPNQIIEKLITLLDKDAVRKALSEAIPTNTGLICYDSGQENCGELKPNTAGVIFNDGMLRADLFVNAQLLSIAAVGHRKYLPASDGDWSWLQTLNSAYSGSTTSREDLFSLNSGSTFAFEENRLQIVSNYASNEKLTIDTAAIRRDWRGKEYQAGYFRTNSGSFQFMGDSPLRGFRIASTLDTREDLRQSAGNSLQVFLRSRSEVSIFKDGRLISSRFYDAGNQELDTTQLPGGAYDVTLRIRDAAGLVEEETRFYVKNSQLPPADQALYFVEAGELVNTAYNSDQTQSGFASGTGLTTIRAGYHSRFKDQFAFLAGISKVDSYNSLELGGNYLGRFFDIGVGGFAGNSARHGARLELRGQFFGVYLNANYRRVWNNNFIGDQSAEDANADFIGEPNTQAYVSLASQLPFGRIEFSSRFNRRKNSVIETHLARYEMPRLRFADTEIAMGFQFGREEGINTGLLTFEARLSGDHITGLLRPEYTYQNTSPNTVRDMQTQGIVSWHDRDIWTEQDLRLDLRARDQIDQRAIGAEMDLQTQSGRLRLQAENVDQNTGRSTRYTGNGFTSFMVNNSHVKLGGREQSQSAVLIDIQGVIESGHFEILIDGNYRGIAQPGKITAINLRPFETYSIQLRQVGSSFVEFQQQAKQVTLYPGNVVSLEWKIAELDIIFGRILDSKGNPVQNALIHGVSGLATTDEYGLFQAEVRRDIKTLNVETREQTCNISLPVYQVNRGIANIGDATCTNTTNTNNTNMNAGN